MSGVLDELRTQQDQSRARQELLERRQDLFDGRLAILELGAETQGTKRAIMEQGIADVKAEQRAQRTLLHAVHAMQSEHTKTLRQHTADIGASRAGSARSRRSSGTSTSASRPSSPSSTGRSTRKPGQ